MPQRIRDIIESHGCHTKYCLCIECITLRCSLLMLSSVSALDSCFQMHYGSGKHMEVLCVSSRLHAVGIRNVTI